MLSGLAMMALGSVTGFLASPAPALAQVEACDDIPALAGAGPLTTALVSASAGRTTFYKDGGNCPAFGDACREKAYVVTGDRVIISRPKGEFVCAHFVAPKQRGAANLPEVVRSGWLNAADLTPEPPEAPPAWPGVWQRIESRITISAAGKAGDVSVKGEATFGALDPDRVKRGAVNSGEITGEAKPADGALAFAMTDKGATPVDRGGGTDCKVWMRRVGPWLIADDNRQCGGANVSFRGLYSRKGQ